MMYPLVLDLADDGFPVSVTCRVLGFSTQAFNKWRRNPVSRRDWDEAHLINAAMDIHSDDPAFGYRFISDELADAGHVDSERRVWRICSQQRIFSAFAKKKGMRKKAGPPVHDDLVRRNFSAPRANELWLTDITEHRTDEGKLYLCAIKDVFSNRIVGYSIKDRMTSSLAVAALRNAVGLRSPFGTTIIHSDRGSQIFDPEPSSRLSSTTTSPARWAGSEPPATMPRWSPSSHSSSSTCSTASAGRHVRSCALPSSCGSNGPITAGAASALSVASPRSNLRYSRQTFKPPDTYTLESETKPSAAPVSQIAGSGCILRAESQ